MSVGIEIGLRRRKRGEIGACSRSRFIGAARTITVVVVHAIKRNDLGVIRNAGEGAGSGLVELGDFEEDTISKDDRKRTQIRGNCLSRDTKLGEEIGTGVLTLGADSSWTCGIC